MKQNDTRFENISMTGRLCYVFMCIERYLLAKYPDRDWTFFAENVMWQWPKYCWESGWWDYCHRMPGIILEYKTYDDIDDPFVYNTVPREDFDKLSALYKGITDGSDEDELVRVLNIPYEMGLNCAGNYGAELGKAETMGAIIDIEEILKSHNIELPDVPVDEPFIIRDDVRNHNHIIDIWRMKVVDADHLSIILNKGA